MFFLHTFPAFFCGGIAGRLRGSDLGTGDWFNRFFIWGLLVGVRVAVSTQNIYYGLAALVLAGLGASLGYHGQFDLTVQANRNWRNYLPLTLVGMFRFAPLCAAAFFVHHGWQVLPAVLAGVLFVPSYLLGNFVAPRFKFSLNILKATSPSEWGEFFFWGSIYTALVAGLYGLN